jgi:Tfp pilus assembly protein PilF
MIFNIKFDLMMNALPRDFKKNAWIVFALFALVFLIYGQVYHHEFINLDDGSVFTENQNVQHGITWKSLRWAMTNTDVGDWFPLTWISILADYQLWGARAGGHLLMNVFYHALNAVILFFLLRKMTGCWWKSAMVAALFAVHPLRVESVAWASGRKDVLCALFWLLTISAYVRYLEKKNRTAYMLMIGFYACAAMSKAMGVTLPVILLLLDVWPLERFRTRGFRALFFEKLPFWIMAALIALTAYLPKFSRSVISNWETCPWGMRLGNSVVFYVQYLGKTFWPRDLALFYPYPDTLPSFFTVTASALLLGLITYVTIRTLKRSPYLFVGWFWFLVILLPVIGIIKYGAFGIADRYLYLPHIGLFLGFTWALGDEAARRRIPKTVIRTGAVLAIGLLAYLSWQQTRHWKNTVTVNEHALQVTRNNFQAHNDLAAYYEDQGNISAAMDHYAQSLRIRPRSADVMNNVANLLLRSGHPEEAIEWYAKILAAEPDHKEASVNLGLALLQKGRPAEAETSLRRALEIAPDSLKANLGLADVEQRRGNTGGAWNYIAKALSRDPSDEEANYAAGNLKVAQRSYEEAAHYYKRTLEKDPRHFKAAMNLANVFFIEGRYEAAVLYYRKALDVRPGFLLAHLNLGKTYAKLGKGSLASREYEEVLRLSPGNTEAQKLLRDLAPRR